MSAADTSALVKRFAREVTTFLVLMAAWLLATIVWGVSVGCARPAPQTARHMARGAILAVAQAVKIADHECASIAQKMLNNEDMAGAIDLAGKCQKGYDIARHGLLAASYAVDAWGSAGNEQVACAVMEGVDGLQAIVAAVQAAGGVLPTDIADGIAAAEWIVTVSGGAACRVGGK